MNKLYHSSIMSDNYMVILLQK